MKYQYDQQTNRRTRYLAPIIGCALGGLAIILSLCNCGNIKEAITPAPADVPTGCPEGFYIASDEGTLVCVPEDGMPAEGCPEGFFAPDSGTTCVAVEPYPYTVCTFNPAAHGTEAHEIGGWFIIASVEDGNPVYVYKHPDVGCYYFSGPTLLDDKEDLTVRGFQPCFGDFNVRGQVNRFARLNLPVERNDIPCTADYEVDCRRMDDPNVQSMVEDYVPGTTPSILGCCDLYGDSQAVCDVCPLFPVDECLGDGVKIIGDGCKCE